MSQKPRRIPAFQKLSATKDTAQLKVNVYRLERFHNSGALSNALQGGFFLVKKPLGGCGPAYNNCGTAVSHRSFCRTTNG
jgi:hypothetical protein